MSKLLKTFNTAFKQHLKRKEERFITELLIGLEKVGVKCYVEEEAIVLNKEFNSILIIKNGEREYHAIIPQIIKVNIK